MKVLNFGKVLACISSICPILLMQKVTLRCTDLVDWSYDVPYEMTPWACNDEVLAAHLPCIFIVLLEGP